MGVGVQTRERTGPCRHPDQVQNPADHWNSTRGRKFCKGFPVPGSCQGEQAGRGPDRKNWKGWREVSWGLPEGQVGFCSQE